MRMRRAVPATLRKRKVVPQLPKEPTFDRPEGDKPVAAARQKKRRKKVSRIADG